MACAVWKPLIFPGGFKLLESVFCVLLNLSVPFLLAFILSSQFNPKGYFSYSMFFVFLALMPPGNQEEFVTELFVFWFCMVFLTAAVWLYGRFFLK